jgi:hypothetical protein
MELTVCQDVHHVASEQVVSAPVVRSTASAADQLAVVTSAV